MTNPYQNLPEKAFWKPACGNKNFLEMENLWSPKFNIRKVHKVSTFGSCFAQYIGRALKERKYSWYCAENAPSGLSVENKKKFNYEVFSARTGNIYTTTLLQQWVDWALEYKTVPDEIWTKDGRFFDPFMPAIEPNGYATKDELLNARSGTINAFKDCLINSNFFVFTLGLTERWINVEKGYEYPMCPGTVAGDFDESTHHFSNLTYPQIRSSLVDVMHKIKKVNKSIKFILTVSPVPLTATMSNNHVVVATTGSKSILRAVAGNLSDKLRYVDYFPSYEIICTVHNRGIFYEANSRSVSMFGVNHVMDNFFGNLNSKFGKSKATMSNVTNKTSSQEPPNDTVCEEELLGAFG